MQSLKVIILFATILVAQQARASPLIDQSDIPIINLNAENDYVQPEARNLLGDVLGGVGTGLGDLANAITSLNLQIKAVPKENSISAQGMFLKNKDKVLGANSRNQLNYLINQYQKAPYIDFESLITQVNYKITV